MKERLREVFGVREDQESNEKIRERIHENAKVTGTNMYILIFAILIACIGLNMNSTAVVIGAMLISPIMGVIVSVAYGIAGNEVAWIKTSLLKFVFQVVVCVITSTIYFLISPMHSFSSELLARTQPTLWDVLIALFGGFAAIIASTRKNIISNVIPGTAIATALMPPVCTVGYCIASGKWKFALGAGYLFVINAIFICLASVIGLRVMKVTSAAHSKYTKRNGVIIGILILISVVPSAIMAWNSVRGTLAQEKFSEFIKNEFQFEGTQVVKSNLKRQDKLAEVMLVGEILEEDQIHKIKDSMPKYQLQDYQLEIVQTHMEQGITKEDLGQFMKEDPEEDLSGIQELKNLLKMQADEKKMQTNALKELKILYPSIKMAGFSDLYEETGKSQYSLLLMVEEKLNEEETGQIKQWLKQKFNKEIILIQFLEEDKE